MYSHDSSQIRFYYSRTEIFEKICNISALNAKYVNEEINIDSLVITPDEKYFFDSNIEPIVATLANYFVRIIIEKDSSYNISDSTIEISFDAAPLTKGRLTQVEVDILDSLIEEYLITENLRLWYHSVAPYELLATKYASEANRIDARLREVLFQFYKPINEDSIINCIKISDGKDTDSRRVSDYSDPVEGSQLLMTFWMEPDGDVHLENCEFEVQYYTTTIEKCHKIAKNEMVKKDADTYLAKVETDLTGAGTLKYVATITMPNKDFAADDTLKLIKNVTTSVNIRPMPK